MMRDSWLIDHRLASREDHPRGRHRRATRRLDSFRGQTVDRIPTPIVHGRGGHRTVWRPRPPSRATLRHGVRCLENFTARARRPSEQKDPHLAADIRAIVEPYTYADPELKSPRRYTNLSAAEVREALIKKGYCPEELPAERTMRAILNRMNYRLKRIQKGKPLKKTDQTDAIFANVQAVQEQVRNDPEALEISMDTKAKVALGDYVRGGKNPDGRPR